MQSKVSNQSIRNTHDNLLILTEIIVKFARVERAPRYPDGKRETDVEHSFHLSLAAVELATAFYPELDAGLVAQFGLVHDLPEVYSGDVRTLKITDAEIQKKYEAEAKATKRLLTELPPYLAKLLERYEEQIEPEARFVRLVDKMLPAIINTLAGKEVNTFKEDYDISNAEELRAIRAEQVEKLKKMFPDEFPLIHKISALIMDTSVEHIFKDS